MQADPDRDFIRLGGDFFIAFLYGEVDDVSELHRGARAIWLELKSDDVAATRKNILDSGLVKQLDIPDPHLYFQAPGGQCLRLVGMDEDLSFYEGTGTGPDMEKIKAARGNNSLNLNYTTAKYSAAIESIKPPNEVFEKLVRLDQWWPEEFEGESLQPGAEFVLKTGDGHYSKNKVTEFLPGQKLAWLTTESRRKADGFDWSGTKMIFDLSPQSAGTLLTFTYDGVVLEEEKERLAQICDLTIKELFYNFISSFSVTITVPGSPREVFTRITRDVAKWWGGPDLSGSTAKLQDEFLINHPGAHYSKQRIVELIPDTKVVWLVTESKLDWLQKDQEEWTNTRMIFKLSADGDQTLLHFTHEGLVPEKACYALCHEGWNTVIKDYMFNLIVHNKPHFS